MIGRSGLVLLALCLAQPAAAAVISVINADGPGEGLNDPTPVAPIGGNTGTTLGEQRLIAFQYAADIWGAILSSSVEIEVEATFDPLACDATSATLGAAGPTTVHRDYLGAPRSDTWYPQALANSIAGFDLDADPDVFAFFNSAVGTTCAFPKSWYYGLDASPGPNVDFVSVVLHEIGHGLGFLSLVNLSSGAKLEFSDDSYMLHLRDLSAGLSFPEMTNAQRAAAQVDDGDLFWTGPAVQAASGGLAAGRDVGTGYVEIYAPSPIEPGSSVSHFSTTLSPNEIMEPVYTGANHDPGLALELMVDIGWNCGDGSVDATEECDDGNKAGGDGCSALCAVEACYTCAGSPSVCSHAPPLSGCLSGTAAGKGLLLLKDSAEDSGDKLIWKWLKGQATDLADFGTPATEDYSLCVYDQSGGGDSVVMSLLIPAGSNRWSAKPTGHKYVDKFLGHDGAKVILLKEGSDGKAKIIVKGKGGNLPMPALGSLVPPLTVQLSNDSTCWESSFGSTILSNEPGLFKAKAD